MVIESDDRGDACRRGVVRAARCRPPARRGDRQLNLAPLRATNWKNIQLHLAKY